MTYIYLTSIMDSAWFKEWFLAEELWGISTRVHPIQTKVDIKEKL